jgi:hypothetical protein
VINGIVQATKEAAKYLTNEVSAQTTSPKKPFRHQPEHKKLQTKKECNVSHLFHKYKWDITNWKVANVQMHYLRLVGRQRDQLDLDNLAAPRKWHFSIQASKWSQQKT